MLLVINFHYVRDTEYPYPGIHPVSVREFRSQLTELSCHLEFIRLDDIFRRKVANGGEKGKHYGLITFDDGLREQFDYAVPVLNDMGIPAVFFINTPPIVKKTVLSVHKLHWLRATRSPSAFLEEFLNIARGLEFDISMDIDEGVVSAQYLYDDLETKKLKYLINHKLPPALRDYAVDRMFEENQDERAYSEELYMTEQQIREIAQPHSIGSHTHSHFSLATLDVDELQVELWESKSILERITRRKVASVSYPYGGTSTVNDFVFQYAMSAGYKMGFTMERSFNKVFGYPLRLARVSTNDAPGGKKPLVRFNDDGSVNVTHPMRLLRKLEEQ